MAAYTLYTDGACSGNPGPGGWAYIILHDTDTHKASGGEIATTNNRMELIALIRGLESIPKQESVTVFSDSRYIVDTIEQKWWQKWQANGWRTSARKPVANQDLWNKAIELIQNHQVKFNWVKGHAENKYNEECDVLAVAAIARLKAQ